jgi:hypothetical protein
LGFQCPTFWLKRKKTRKNTSRFFQDFFTHSRKGAQGTELQRTEQDKHIESQTPDSKVVRGKEGWGRAKNRSLQTYRRLEYEAESY